MIYSKRLRIIASSTAVALVAAATWLGPQFAGAASNAPAASSDAIWRSIDQIPASSVNARVDIKAASFKTFGVDRQQLSARLSQAHMEFSAASAQNKAAEITLPTPDGNFARFRVEEIAIMEPELAAKYPGIKAYRGRGIDDPSAVLHLDVNPLTLHAQVRSPAGTWYVDPYRQHDDSVYMSYSKDDLLLGDRQLNCLVDGADGAKDTHTTSAAATDGTSTSKAATAGTMLRTYRIAYATSAQYSLYHGGPTMDVPKILAAIVTMNNRVSGVYETELGIRMILVAKTDQIIATTTNPTPYSDTPGDIGTNPAYIDTKIGEPNYDIGHVVTTGSGGIAGLGVVCRGFNVVSGGSAKARGTTGTNPPVGDGFWIDFVAHEIGHQFGGNHTFDGTGTNCGTNQNEETAYEPGSGTTIQAYAGICGNQNIQRNSDPFFHFISLKEMFGYASGAAARAPGVVLQKAAASDEEPGTAEANPSKGTLNPTGPEVTWKGTAPGGASEGELTCVEGVNCDTFILTLSGDAGDWANKVAQITFTWPSPVDDYDIYVRKGSVSGPLVASAASSSQPEVVTIDPAVRGVGTGEFAVRVVYFAAVGAAGQYNAVAKPIDLLAPGDAPTCAALTPTGNTPPTVEAGPNYKIPARTPFTLTAVGSDANGDPITYSWEEADLGPAPKDVNQPDDGKNPLFRSFAPISSPQRTYPSFPYILNNANVPPVTYQGTSPTGAVCAEGRTCVTGEQLPTTTRELNFNVTARDNVFGGWSMDAMKLEVVDGGKGFAVTAPNAAATFEGGAPLTVTWDVANTTGPEINTTNVNILVAVDSGLGPNNAAPVFRMLLANTPNDGSEVVTLPKVNTTKARIMVQAVGNVFFDVSDADFAISTPGIGELPSQLLNISTRLRVQTGDNVLIGGFIVTGDAPKKVVLRAMGPSLSSGGTPVAGRLDDPTLELLDSAGNPITFNDNWKDSDGRADIEAIGLQPGDDRESAIARTLAPGLYTAIVRGANNSTGIGLVEAYDGDSSASTKLANISTRGFVETGDNVMIGGFIVGEQSSGIRVVARATGPSLKSQLPQALDDPMLQLVDRNGNTIRSNDNWKDSSDRAAIEAAGLAPQQDAEPAVVANLGPAPYTVIIRGKNDTTGVGVVEIYQIPSAP